LISGEETVTLYEEAARKNPRDEEFGKYWFQKMIMRNNIDAARKVQISY
jgi:hypothetical protein